MHATCVRSGSAVARAQPWLIAVATPCPPRCASHASAAQGGETLSAEAVEAVLEEVRPFLQMAGGEISLQSLSTTGIAPTATLLMQGEGAALTSVKVEIQQRLKRKLPALVNIMWA